MEEKEIRERWEGYIEELYHDDRGQKPIIKELEGLPIQEEEIAKVLKKIKLALT